MRAGRDRDYKYSFYSTTGGSMLPFICPNEQIVVKRSDSHEITNGDIILYRDKNNYKVAHRVVWSGKIGDKLFFQTKGDNNANLDNPITEDQIIGRVIILRRKNALFSFIANDFRWFGYKLSSYSIFVRRLYRRAGRKILFFLQSNCIFRKLLRRMLRRWIKISMGKINGEEGAKCYKFSASLFGHKAGESVMIFDNRGWGIWSLGVNALFRGAGVARKISESQIQFAKKSGAAIVTINVRQDNIPSVNNFYKLGFRNIEGTEKKCENTVFINMALKI